MEGWASTRPLTDHERSEVGDSLPCWRAVGDTVSLFARMERANGETLTESAKWQDQTRPADAGMRQRAFCCVADWPTTTHFVAVATIARVSSLLLLALLATRVPANLRNHKDVRRTSAALDDAENP